MTDPVIPMEQNTIPLNPENLDANPTSAEGTKKRKSKRNIIIAVIVAFLLVIAGVVYGGVSYSKHLAVQRAQEAAMIAREKASAARLNTAYSLCTFTATDDGETMQVADTGGTLTYSNTASGGVQDLDCVLGSLKTPQSVISKMNATTALDGMQSDQWDGIKVTWSYNGNSGFNAVFEYSK